MTRENLMPFHVELSIKYFVNICSMYYKVV